MRWLDAIRERWKQQSNHESSPRTRFCCLGAILVLILTYFIFRTGDRPAITPAIQPAVAPVQPPISTPPPIWAPEAVIPAPVTAMLDTRTAFAPIEPASEPVAPEANFNQETALTNAPDNSALEDDNFLARYLDRPTGGGRNSASIREHPAANGSLVAFGKFQAGYGKIFTDDSLIACGRNWAAREEAGCLFLKVSFRF